MLPSLSAPATPATPATPASSTATLNTSGLYDARVGAVEHQAFLPTNRSPELTISAPRGREITRRLPRRLPRNLAASTLLGTVLGLCILAGATATQAQAAEVAAPGWEVTSTTYPTHLHPGGGKGDLEVNLYDTGAKSTEGPITVTDQLPEGVIATEAGDHQSSGESEINEEGLWHCNGQGTSTITCTSDEEKFPTFPIPQVNSSGQKIFLGQEENGVIAHLALRLEVAGTKTETATNHVTVSGGGAATPASTESPVTISTAPVPFGLANIDGWVDSADGTTDTQAGSHPYDVSFFLDLNSFKNGENGERGNIWPAGGQPRDIAVNLPPGFVGNPTAVPQCTRQQFDETDCPADTQVGIDTADAAVIGENTINPAHSNIPVYNVVPPPGEAAQFAFDLLGVQAFIDAKVRSGGDYGITGSVRGIPQKEVSGNRITLWGEPADPGHDGERSTEFGDGGKCQNGCASGGPRVPFFTLPTACEGPQSITATVSAWENPSLFGEKSFTPHDNAFNPVGTTGCDHLGFAPTITVSPDTSSADSPAGITVDVHAAQEGLTSTEGLGTSSIKATTVALPAGFVINPGQAAGLQACEQGPTDETAPGEVKYPGRDNLPLPGENGEAESFEGPADCPKASKVGTVQVTTPLLKEKLEGEVFVMQSNPPDVKLLVTASAQGVNLKLIGDAELCETVGEVIHGKACEAPGQLITTFSRTPELPFTDFKLSFNGGAQAALDTPTQCRDNTPEHPGEYTTTSDFTPWSTPSVADANPSSAFAISSGPGGSPCPGATLPFAPSMIAGATSDQAGAFTDFSLLLQRGDDQQRIEKLAFTNPPGLSGMVTGIPLCSEAQANAGTCPAASHIGHAIVSSGPGPYPLVLPQPGAPELPIYLTGPYKGAPFGLSIVTPVIAGPFNLGTIVTRAKIEINPHTSQISVVTDPLPQIVDGVPTDLRSIDSVIDRPNFLFNPSNCEAHQFAGTATSTTGTNAPLTSHFGVGSCRELGFHALAAASTGAKGSRSVGVAVKFKITIPKAKQGTQAWVKEIKFTLPKQISTRLTTIQKACPSATFEGSRANCPPASIIGHAVVHTPVLPVPLEGPVYFVSYAGAKFPEVVLVIKGDNVTIEEHGETLIKHGVTTATFRTIPDEPFESVEVTLPQGPFGEFAANLPNENQNFCGRKLTMKTFFKAQNGLESNQTTPLTATGCPKAKKLTRAQKLAAAMKACKKKHNKNSRAACVRAARKRYGPLGKKAQKAKRSGHIASAASATPWGLAELPNELAAFVQRGMDSTKSVL